MSLRCLLSFTHVLGVRMGRMENRNLETIVKPQNTYYLRYPIPWLDAFPAACGAWAANLLEGSLEQNILNFDWFVPQTWSTSLCKVVKVVCFTAASSQADETGNHFSSILTHPWSQTAVTSLILYNLGAVSSLFSRRYSSQVPWEDGGNKCSHYSADKPLHKWKVTEAVYSCTLEFPFIQTSDWIASGDLSS